MAYDAYAHFIGAARKFPRWTNTRRRPTESNGGKVLRSIIEEIAAVEDEIIEFKKDFFIVNYIGREEEIIDYLYSAHVGDIEDLTAFTAENPKLLVTDDKELFYNDTSYAYYEKGYLVMRETNDENRLEYTYNSYMYYAEIIEDHVWNVIDEFAWWCGLERFEGERNASLLQRCMYQLHRDEDNPLQDRRPNSTEKGLKNTLCNAASVLGNLSEDEIQFLEPNEETLSIKNDGGITLYEQIARFNRDIARTRQWDIDYWDNNFRKLYYLPHVWDAEVDSYKNGVGYMDSLFVSTSKEMNVENSVNLTVKGYKPSRAMIEQYIQANQITKNIPLELTRYGDTINPLQVQYKIRAEEIVQVEDPSQIILNFYKHDVGNRKYRLENFVESYQDGILTENKGELEPDKDYKLIFKSSDNGVSRMEIESCYLDDGNTKQNLLTENANFIFSRGTLVEKSVLLHATIADHVESPENLETYRDGGIVLSKPLETGSFQISLGDFLSVANRNFVMPVSGGFQYITFLPQYVTALKYTKTADGTGWTAPTTDSDFTDILTISSSYCRKLEFDVDNTGEEAYAEITVRIDGRINENLSTRRLMANGNPFIVELTDGECHAVEVVVQRISPRGFTIRNIRMAAYHVGVALYNRNSKIRDFSLEKELILPRTSSNDCRVICTINNYMGTSPVIEYVHVGSQMADKEYQVTFNTNGVSVPKLVINTNCTVTLYKNNIKVDEDYHTYTTYRNTNVGKAALYLDLGGFSAIYATTPTSKKYRDNIYTILLNPGETLSEITIDGNGYTPTIKKTLKELLDITTEQLYLTRTLKGFILHSPSGDRIQSLERSAMGTGDKVVIQTNINKAIQGCFVVNGVDHLSNEYIGVFNSFYLYPDNVKDYIAYNVQPIIQNTTYVSIIDNFIPELKKNNSLVYVIEDIIPSTDIDVNFEHTVSNTAIKRKWSIDYNEDIIIEAAQYENINSDIVSTETITISPSFRLSNTISLEGLRSDMGSILDLGLYTIKPPASMHVVYGSETTYRQTEYGDGGTMYVEEDGFNKLKHSNVVAISKITLANNTVVPISNYTLLKEAGIVVWNLPKNSDIWNAGIKEIVYTYKQPASLKYNTINDLYDLTGYQISTMECVNKRDYRIKDANNKDKISVDYSYFEEVPTMIAVTCDSSYYMAKEEDGIIYVSKIAEDNTPIIHNGYYYIDGREYYYFANKREDDEKRVDGVNIENAELISGNLLTQQEAINYLENSRMECNRLNVHCIVDFNHPRIEPNVEPLGHIGACESFAAWHDYGMNRAMTTYKNGYATMFSSKDNGYALLDITNGLRSHKTVSCLYTGGLKFSLAREIRIMNEQALKSVFCEKIAKFNIFRDIAYYVCDDANTDRYRYYLVVEGSGTLDEVLILDETKGKEIAAWHEKGIDKIGFLIDEIEETEKEIDLEYSSDFISYCGLETDSDGYLRTGTTVDWNITKYADLDLDSAATRNILKRNDVWISRANGATIETKPIEIDYRYSIQKMALKVNDLAEGNFKGFTIKVFASNIYDGTYSQVADAVNANLAGFAVSDNYKYLKFQVTASQNKIIRSMTLFAIYKEDSKEDLIIHYNDTGSAVTKVLDIGAKGNYRFKEVIATEDSSWNSIYVRGARESSNGEIIWSTWQDTKSFPDFTNCQLFQFKIIMSNKQQKAIIKAFRFEVLANV